MRKLPRSKHLPNARNSPTLAWEIKWAKLKSEENLRRSRLQLNIWTMSTCPQELSKKPTRWASSATLRITARQCSRSLGRRRSRTAWVLSRVAFECRTPDDGHWRARPCIQRLVSPRKKRQILRTDHSCHLQASLRGSHINPLPSHHEG